MFKTHVTVTAVSLGAATEFWGPQSVVPVSTIFTITSVSQRKRQDSGVSVLVIRWSCRDQSLSEDQAKIA